MSVSSLAASTPSTCSTRPFVSRMSAVASRRSALRGVVPQISVESPPPLPGSS